MICERPVGNDRPAPLAPQSFKASYPRQTPNAAMASLDGKEGPKNAQGTAVVANDNKRVHDINKSVEASSSSATTALDGEHLAGATHKRRKIADGPADKRTRPRVPLFSDGVDAQVFPPVKGSADWGEQENQSQDYDPYE